MKFTIRLIAVIALIIVATLPAAAQVEKGQKSVGFQCGYATFNTSALAGVSFRYSFSRHFRLAPSVDYIFSHKDINGLMFNLDYQCPIAYHDLKNLYFYPVVGVNYASWHRGDNTLGTAEDESASDVSSRVNKLGLDFGAGIEWYVNPTLRLSLEGKFNWVTHANTGLFYLGISYVF